jgi:SagB-type dehydrogenase family enzyme
MEPINYKVLISTIFILFLPILVGAEEMKQIKLLKPQTDNGRPIMQALKERKSWREFSAKNLPLQVISNLLWAANGINRPESGGRTAPTAMDMKEIDVYVAMKEGLYLYDAKENALIPVLAQDIREATGEQPFVKEAPINLIYVADMAKMSKVAPGKFDFFASCDTGFISENVYLYCASEGLATVVRGWFNPEVLAKAMKLRASQKVILTQTVGYPK